MNISAEEFNRLYPVGTPVRFYPIIGEPKFEQTATRSEAWELGHGAPVVMVKGRTGGVCLEAVEVAHAGNSLTIVVSYDDGLFIASHSDGRIPPLGIDTGPRDAALLFASSCWGRGNHLAVCSEVHGDKLSATFIITREEVAHAA